MSESNINLNAEESWTNSRSYARYFEPIPSAVGIAVQTTWRNFVENEASGENEVSPESQESLRRMDRSSKLKTPLYFAAGALYPEKVSATREDEASKAVVEVLGPGLFATLLALVYLHKRSAKILEKTDWESLSKEWILHAELGFIVGSTVSHVGPAIGTLVGGIRHAAIMAFMMHSAEQFSKYRNLKKKRFDYEYEHAHWGCDHAQIAAYILQSFGLRRDLFEMASALRTLPPSVPLPAELKRWKAAAHMIEAIKEGGYQLPAQASDLGVVVSAEESALLKERIAMLFKGQSRFTWMLRAAKVEVAAEQS
jgi:hypothetical protein